MIARRSLPGWLPLSALLLAALLPGAVTGQEAEERPRQDAWDGPRVRRLVAEAIEARRHAYSDSSLHAFRARAEAHVYYLGEIGAVPLAGEAPEGEQMVKADQVALRILWEEPDRSLQTVVGRRDRARLPTSIRYHLDHLTAVLENFGDRIDVGEGTEVSGVPHPLSPGAPEHYRYRLADSLRLVVAGRERRLYRVEVRPRRPDLPGVVGELQIERDSRALARMRITFTPASYLDPDLESITVDLQSALWEDRWWLPAEQRTTVRRRFRWLTLPLAGTIRTHLRVLAYDVNPEESFHLPEGRRVVSLPESQLEAYDDWSYGLWEGPVGEAARGDVETERLRRRARELMPGRTLLGGARLAPHGGGVSELVRVRRAEGFRAGAGVRWRPVGGLVLTASAAHPFKEEGVPWRATLEASLAGGRVSLEGYEDRLTDVGPWPGASGLVSTLGFLLRGEDFTDPYFRDGVRAGYRRAVGPAGLVLGLGVAWEEHRRASLLADAFGEDVIRPVRPVREGDLGALTLGARLPLPLPAGTWSLDLEGEGATEAVGDFGFTRLLVELTGRSGSLFGAWRWRVDGGLGVAGGDLPPQRLLLLGGRGTLPGHAFRRWGGSRAAHLRAEGSRQLLGPWVALRGVVAAGWAEVGDPGAEAAAAFGGPHGGALRGTSGVEPSAGLGLGFLDGTLRLDAVKGLDGGRWEWIVSVDPRFRSML